MAEKGYPSNHAKGNVIYGLNSHFGPNVKIFHASTIRNNNKILTAGGRVLGVTALGSDFNKARSDAYDSVRKIHWGADNHYYRKDIGLDT
jgi:phosphoribosylamine--glycine ligase